MRRGLKGLRCCGGAFDVWGLSCDAPNLKPLHFGGGYFDALSTPPGLVVLPDVGSPGPNGPIWTYSAAKVPSSYPYAKCDPFPPISSADPLAAEPWEADLGIAGEIQEQGEEPSLVQVYTNFHVAYSSRVICEDGVQKWVTYTITPYEDAGNADRDSGFNTFANIKDHVQISVADPSDSTTYAADNLDIPLGTCTLMQFLWRSQWWSGNPSDNGGSTESNAFIGPAQNTSYGKEFFIVSNYRADQEPADWGVGRLEYDGMVVFTTGPADGAVDALEGYVGDYPIMLPAIRVNIDSSVVFDECWVCAKNGLDSEGDPSNKLVLGQWQNTLMRGLDLNPDEDIADGTLQESEVAVVVVDGSYPPDDFSTEPFTNIQVRCYNRVYDPETGHNRNLLIFTTDPPEGTQVTAEPLADFEQDVFDPDYLDNGVDDYELHFEVGGTQVGNEWLADGDDAHTGTYSAKANINATTAGQVDLLIEFNAMEAGFISFWYLHDNRFSGVRGSFTSLTNFADVDNTLEIFINGAHVPMTIDMNDYTDSVIDNVNAPSGNPFNDETFYSTWRKVTVGTPAGPHILRISLFRRFADDDGNLNSRVDDIQFPELLVGDDANNLRRWFYDGEKVRRAKWWSWPFRDDENAISTNVSSRVSTLPDFINLAQDGSGRIIYGNSHYIYVLKYDEGDDEWYPDPEFGDQGKFVFSASPEIPQETEYLDGECNMVSILRLDGGHDPIRDPPYGQMQILATRHGIQLRGMNGAWRDRTVDGVALGAFSDEQFVPLFSATNGWSRRIHGWTISYDGKEAKPHVEVIWRVPRETKAWPVAPATPDPRYPNPPFHYKVEYNSSELGGSQPPYGTLEFYEYMANRWARVRDPLKIEGSEDKKPQWTARNKIISRVYCDSYSRSPQHIWTQNPAPDPEPTIGSDPNPAYDSYPWPAGQFICVPAFHCPTSAHMARPLFPLDQRCNTEDEDVHDVWDTFSVTDGASSDECNGGYADFDAVDDCDCGCC